ncbi:RNA ligase RtcB family protein [Lampropedia puyangensis]|uniref:3'-phosphate/5'-hydroxy nucleic acid ligase n=1 Tax=Lampropedia puyangensis TaxID=1330072 RepID=A0A4S8F9V9_9BURK|nr:RNA ligase RtcB family protein [Lampropedia puyangensis]THU04019.1 RNA ligase RtcB family protein [Lampropedia puyangensis]
MGNTNSGTYVRVFANDSVWMEDSAVEQLQTTARNLSAIRAAVGLPDLHPGRGYPVGAAFFSINHFYPALVGGDIGCGMQLLETDLASHKTSPSKIEKALGNIDSPLPEHSITPATYGQLEQLAQQAGDTDLRYLLSMLGTIGGGNHFAEWQAVDAIYEEGVLNKKQLYLLVHSGSRGLGGAILRQHVERFGHAGLVADSTAAKDYLDQHDAAIGFAQLNRQHIASRMLRAVRATGRCMLDVTHNHVGVHQWQGQQGYLHRKGATPSDQGLVVIPGSRGDFSYVVRPVASRHDALDSLAHGAGRKWARSDCKGRLKPRFTLAALQQTRFGSTVVCADKDLIYEEAPQAYKEVDGVVQTLLDCGLLHLVARLKPVLTYKKGAMACC